jgi:hypothetical protein
LVRNLSYLKVKCGIWFPSRFSMHMQREISVQ